VKVDGALSRYGKYGRSEEDSAVGNLEWSNHESEDIPSRR
jgi:hypothetical protein